MIAYFKQFVNTLDGNLTKIYLVTANIVLVCFAIWFSNAGLLPFKNVGDFAFFVGLTLILAVYRPGWTFLFFIGTLALENINLAPTDFGISLRPYQFFGFITILALLVHLLFKRLTFPLPKFKWLDALPIIFVLGGFLSIFGAIDKGVSFKQSVIALSFVALYFLTRVYVQSVEDLKRVAPFFLSTGLVVAMYAIWQNVRFLVGANSFEVMPGRPNATFTEADWLGMYLVFLLSIILTIIFYQSKKTKLSQKNNNQDANIKKISNFKNQTVWSFVSRISTEQKFGDWILFGFCFLYLVICNVVLILTVSRSAWIGAVFVTVVFLKFVLLRKFAETSIGVKNKWKRFFAIFKINLWQWREAGIHLIFILFAFGIALLISIPLTRFEIGNRAVSTGGLQKITIACTDKAVNIPSQIKNISELAQYGCRHINLEEIEKEKNVGNVILEVLRPDPNVNIRAEIYKKAIVQIKENPILGIGWGSISAILGADERGAGLNASNIFLEVWLGSGVVGFLSFVILLGFFVFASISTFIGGKKRNEIAIIFVMLGWVAIVFPNIFNSGIFLGFVWTYLGIAIGLLEERGA